MMKEKIFLFGKEGLNVVSWIFVFLTILSLMGTLLTNYRIMPIKYCDNYKTFQVFMCLTMSVMSIKLFDFKSKEKNWRYSILCLLIAAGTVFFMYMQIY